MHTSIQRLRLVLWTGRSIPVPAPALLTNALATVKVTNDEKQGDGFQIAFTVYKGKASEFDLLRGGALTPLSRVVVGVALGATPQVLIDGVITNVELNPGDGPGTSTLTVTGSDVSLMLDLEERNQEYKNQPDSLIVGQIVEQYAELGLIPELTPTTDVPLETDHVRKQHETDLAFIRRLGRENGFVLYIEPRTFGANTVYWGPPGRLGLPQPALTTNMGALTNVRSLTASADALAPVSASGKTLNEPADIAIPIPSLPSLRQPPLVREALPARRKVLLRQAANQTTLEGALAALAAGMNAADPVRVEGELDTIRYGHVLRARALVGVRGAGASYDGTYYVSRVTHSISRQSYTQQFSLRREGTGSLLPVVRP